jgi:hypothetical protein
MEMLKWVFGIDMMKILNSTMVIIE